MNVRSIQTTPNPNAFKFVVDAPLAVGGARNIKTPAECADDPLATALLATAGVEGLYFCEDFVTVSMTGDADWRQVADQVRQILEAHEAPQGVAETPVTPPVKQPLAGGDQEMLDRINELLDERVRPALAGDGGGLEILSLEGKTLHIRYQGACGSCPSSIQGTLVAIQNLLQSELDQELMVVPA